MLKVRNIGNHTIITILKVPELACTEQGKLLKNLFMDLIDNNKTKSIVVDLKKVIFLNSSIVGTLLNGQKMAKNNSIAFSLMYVHPELLNMLELASIKDLFTIYSTERELSLN